MGGVWVALMEGDPHEGRTYDHVAWKIPEDAFGEYERRVRDAGLEVRAPRPRVPGERRSLYFHDYDGHLFELHTGTLAERLACYRDEGAGGSPDGAGAD